MKIALVLLVLIVLLLVGQRWFFSFDAQKPEDYADTSPAFDIREQLSGALVSEGVIYGPDGRVASRFVARMEGVWTGDSGRLTESFKYAGDGGTLDREWTLNLGQDGSFTATAPDVVGTGEGRQSGATARMTYRIRLAEDAGGHVLDVVDWLYLMENGTIINRSEMRKFGVKVAELVATIRPAD